MMREALRTGDVVVCIDQGLGMCLTDGKLYVVEGTNGELVRLIDDNGGLNAYYQFRFKLNRGGETAAAEEAAGEYDEIMKGEELWVSIQTNSAR